MISKRSSVIVVDVIVVVFLVVALTEGKKKLDLVELSSRNIYLYDY